MGARGFLAAQLQPRLGGIARILYQPVVLDQRVPQCPEPCGPTMLSVRPQAEPMLTRDDTLTFGAGDDSMAYQHEFTGTGKGMGGGNLKDEYDVPRVLIHVAKNYRVIFQSLPEYTFSPSIERV